MASQEEAVLTYKASDMVLAIHSDESYLSEPKARSRAGGHMFMSSNDNIPTNNGAVLNISQIIRAVMSSAAEAELGVSMRHTLEEMGHPQPRTPIQTDNKTANDLLTNKIMPKALKAMDMRFHWLRCRDAQGQFQYYWRPGTQNLADYFTKHHPASHHKASQAHVLNIKLRSTIQETVPHVTGNEVHRNYTHEGFNNYYKILREITNENRMFLHNCTMCLSNLRQGCVRPTKIGNAVMAGIGTRQNHKTP